MLDGAAAPAAVDRAGETSFDSGETETGTPQNADPEGEAHSTEAEPGQTESADPSATATIIVVDAALQDIETLLSGVDPKAEILMLEAGSDGIHQITRYLEGRSDVSALHILSHGDIGSVTLGTTILSDANAEAYAAEFIVWDAALNSGADILLYGCNVGAGGEGADFLDLIADMTGADIAASDDMTGHSDLGGDWQLEENTGAIEAAIVISGTAQAQFGFVLASSDTVTFAVANAGGTSITNYASSSSVANFDFTVTAASGGLTGNASINANTTTSGQLFGFLENTSAGTAQGTTLVITETSNGAFTINSFSAVIASNPSQFDLTATLSTGATQTISGGGTFTFAGGVEVTSITLSATYTSLGNTNLWTVNVDDISFSINNAPVNTVPGAQTTNEDTALSISGISVSDADGDSLTTTISVSNGVLAVANSGTVSNNNSGSVTISGTASQINTALAGLTYMPNPDFNGTDTLLVSTTDGSLTDNNDTVTITVSAVTDVTDDTIATDEDTPITFNPITGTNGATADTFSDATRSITAITQGAHGTITNNGDGTLTYTLNADFNGADSFTYTVTAGGVAETATVNVTINAVADITDDTIATNEDTPITFNPITGTNSATADTFSDTTRSITAVTQGANGSVTNNGDGTLTYTPNADFNGADNFTYTVTAGGITEIALVNVTIAAVNDSPVNTVPSAQTATEDTAIAIPGVSVADADGDTLTTNLSVSNGILSVPNSSLVITNNASTISIIGTASEINTLLNSLTYTPNDDFNGTDTLAITTTDNILTDNNDIVQISVNAVADATDDTISTNEDTAITFNPLTGTNGATADTFSDVSRSITATTQGVHGTVTNNGNGTLTYTPDADFNGADSFIYTVTAGGVTETATVNVTINAVADITDDTIATNEDTPITFNPMTGTNGATADTFSDATRSITAITQGAHGTVTNNGDGTLTYTPDADFNGTDSFTYTVTAGGVAETATVNVTINAVADITDDTIATNEDTPITFNPITGTNGATADTFSDVTRSITAITQGAHGTITNNGDGTLTYTPNADFNGADSFTYTVIAGGVAETATVNVTINAVADITDDTIATNEDIPITFNPITGTNGATADTFSDATRSITAITQGTNGSVTNNGNGTLTYTPNADFNGADSFTYTVTAGGVAETATVNVTVTAVADITDDTIATNEDTPITFNPVTGTNGATADTFSDATRSITAITQGANGNVTNNGNGTLTYMPNADFNGTDSFTYTVTAGGVTETATVNVTINPVADATDDAVTTNEDTPITFNPVTGTNGATADTFSDATRSITAITQGANGTVTNNGDGTLTYTPNADFNGTDSFNYTVTAGGVTETATVNVTINPVADATDDAVTTNEDTAITFDPIIGTNGANADTFSDPIRSITSVSQGSNGTAINNGNGTLTYTPDADFNGTDSFTYTVTAGGVTETATVTITINAVADITNDSIATNEDTAITFDPILGTNGATADTFSDPNRTVSAITEGTHGTLVNNGNGTLTYTPDPDFNGTDSFSYTVTAGGVTETATVSVTVNAVADITDDTLTTSEDTSITFDPIAGTNGATADTFTDTNRSISAFSQGSTGSVEINGDGTLTYTPGSDLSGTDTFTYTVAAGGVIETATVTIAVTPVNDAPILSLPGAQTTDDDTAIVFSYANGNAISVSDVDAGNGAVTLNLSVSSGTLQAPGGTGAAISGNGTATLQIDGTIDETNAALAGLTFTPAPGIIGTATISATINDDGNTGTGGALTTVGTISIDVTQSLSSTGTDGANPGDSTASGQSSGNAGNPSSLFVDTPPNGIGPRNAFTRQSLDFFDTDGFSPITVDPLITGTVDDDEDRPNQPATFYRRPVIFDLIPASDTGFSASDNVTADNTPVLTGISMPNAIIKIRSDVAGWIGTTLADREGRWTVRTLPLPDSVHELTVLQRDRDGREGAPSRPLAVTIDTQAPEAPSRPALVAADRIASDQPVQTDVLTGSAEPASKIIVRSNKEGVVAEITTDQSGNWSFDTRNLSRQTHRISVSSVDSAGNTSVPSSVLILSLQDHGDNAKWYRSGEDFSLASVLLQEVDTHSALDLPMEKSETQTIPALGFSRQLQRAFTR